MRVKILLAYNGTPFFGSQVQKETRNTVMGTLQHAFHRLGIDTSPVASGRTDRGVHATGQVVHCDLPDYWHNTQKLHTSLNRLLPPSIRIRAVSTVSSDFHARFSARRRIYRYVLSETDPTPFEADFVTFSDPIDVALMNRAIRYFVGEHDFRHFKRVGSETPTDVRTIYRAFVYRHRGKVIITFEGNGFLRTQVRLMVGFLFAINRGQRTIEDLAEQVACHSDFKVKPAPGNGLYLSKILY